MMLFSRSQRACPILLFCLLLSNYALFSQEKLENYSQKISGSNVVYDLVAIQGGEFLMGSPSQEKNRKDDEGPQHSVKIEPFWMGKYEVIWDLYDLFTTKNIEKEMAKRYPDPDNSLVKTDASTRPSPSYVDMSFGMGRQGYPAINMTQYAAIHFCKWLYDKTGVFYRLPTEAEWEYACRAGSNTAYSFGNNAKQLDEFAWHKGNSGDAYKKIGLKKPNAWGLHDMHGNVMEWTLDQYIKDQYAKSEGNANYPKVTELYPTSVRGGSWDDEPALLRSAARVPSSPDWKILDPQSPKSEWWMTSASFVGFRIVRPLKTPTLDEIKAYYSPPLIEDY